MSTRVQAFNSALKVALTILMDAHPMQREQLSGLIGKINANLIGDAQMLEQIKQIGADIIQTKDRDASELQASIANAQKMSDGLLKDENLSPRQRTALENNKLCTGASAQDSVKMLTLLCETFAEESLHLRSQSQIIVGEEHSKLKKTESNVIAGDVSWSSKQIMNSLDPLMKRLHQEFPDIPELAALCERVKLLKNGKIVDFFEAITVMEDGLRIATKLQGRRDGGEANYLKTFQAHLKNMHAALEESLRSNIAFQAGSDKERQAFAALLQGFKDASDTEDDPVKLRKIIPDNVNHMSLTFKKVMDRQDVHIRQQHRAIDALRVDVRKKELQNKQMEKEHAELAKAILDIKNESLMDPLTEALNRRAYDQAIIELDRNVAKLQDASRCGIIVLDIDHFKKINDTYGHLVGDKVLKAVSKQVREVLSSNESLSKCANLYRYGGEEFVMTYQDLDIQAAAKLAEHLRRRIAQQTYRFNQDRIHISISVGVSHYRPECMDGGKIFDEADKAMYQSKLQGRNRVHILYRNKHIEIKPPVAA